MAKAYRIPDYRKMYPEAGEEVISLLRTTERCSTRNTTSRRSRLS